MMSLIDSCQDPTLFLLHDVKLMPWDNMEFGQLIEIESADQILCNNV